MENGFGKKKIWFWAAPQWSLYDVESPGEINKNAPHQKNKNVKLRKQDHGVVI